MMTLLPVGSFSCSRPTIRGSLRCNYGIREVPFHAILEALYRQKDIQYSSRVASHAARQQQAHRLQHVISQLVQQIPAEQRTSEIGRELARYGCMTQMHVLRLVAPRIENESHTKDIDFSALGISGCCEAGYAATWNASERAPWRGKFDPIEGVIIHEEVAELPSAAEVPQRAASWSITTHATFAWTLQ